MRSPTDIVAIEAGILIDLVTTIRRLHMGAGNERYRMRGCQVCQLVTLVEGELVDYLTPPAEPPPVPAPKPRRWLAAVPEETDGD